MKDTDSIGLHRLAISDPQSITPPPNIPQCDIEDVRLRLDFSLPKSVESIDEDEDPTFFNKILHSAYGSLIASVHPTTENYWDGCR